MPIDNVGTSVVALIEQDKRRVRAALTCQSLTIVPRKEAVLVSHDDEQGRLDLRGVALEGEIASAQLSVLGRLTE